MQQLLLIEHEQPKAVSLKSYLAQLGYQVSAIAESAEQALEDLKFLNPDFIVMDYNLNTELSGKDIYNKIRQQNREIPIIYLSAPEAV